MSVDLNQMEKLNNSLQVQMGLQLQMNGILAQQLITNKNLANGFIGLAKVSTYLMNSLTKFAKSLEMGFEAIFKVIAQKAPTSQFDKMDSLISSTEGVDSSMTQLSRKTEEVAKSMGAVFKTNVKGEDEKPENDTETISMFDSFKENLKAMAPAFKQIFQPLRSMIGNFKQGFQGAEKVFPDEAGGYGKALFKNIFSGLGGGLKNVFKAPFDVLKKSTKGMKGGGLGGIASMLSMGPQMMLLMIALKPIMAILQGLLEPFEPLMDVFSLMGELLGLIIVPIVNEMTQALIYLISGSADLIPYLQDLALGIFQLLSPVWAAIARMSETGESLGDALISVVLDGISKILENVMIIVPKFAEIFMLIFTEIINILPDMITNMQPAIAEAISSFSTVMVQSTWEMMKESARNFGERTRDSWDSWRDRWD